MKDHANKIRKTQISRTTSAVLIFALMLLLFMLLNFIGITIGSAALRVESNTVYTKKFTEMEEAAPIVVPAKEFSLLHVDTEFMQQVQTVYIIPGGGNANGEYPEWTKRRVVGAYQHFTRHHRTTNDAIFVALSAGSLNSANAQGSDKRIVFESQHTIRHLIQLGVPKEIIFGDTFSWDTVTNGLTLRILVEGVQEYRQMNENNFYQDSTEESVTTQKSAPEIVLNSSPAVATVSPPAIEKEEHITPTNPPQPPRLKPLILEVFISDFHADRVRASFEWILGLSPHIPAIELRINAVNSVGVDFGSQLDYKRRIEHEVRGVAQINDNSERIRTVSQFYAFLMLGGHQGLHKYLLYDYQKSEGGGW